jgi:hypothetical protein
VDPYTLSTINYILVFLDIIIDDVPISSRRRIDLLSTGSLLVLRY